MANKPRNPHRISLTELLDREGMTLEEAMEIWAFDSIVPALCDLGCEVEPDGRCEHGNPSVLIALGVI